MLNNVRETKRIWKGDEEDGEGEVEGEEEEEEIEDMGASSGNILKSEGAGADDNKILRLWSVSWVVIEVTIGGKMIEREGPRIKFSLNLLKAGVMDRMNRLQG